MSDLDLAEQILREKSLSLVVVKGGKTLFESHSSGISGLLQAIDNLKEMLHGSFVADRVVGRAAALLLTYSCVKKIYAVTLSSEGLRVLVDNNIQVEYGNLVPKILDKEGKNICPFEKFSLAITSPSEAYEQLKVFAENIRK